MCQLNARKGTPCGASFAYVPACTCIGACRCQTYCMTADCCTTAGQKQSADWQLHTHAYCCCRHNPIDYAVVLQGRNTEDSCSTHVLPRHCLFLQVACKGGLPLCCQGAQPPGSTQSEVLVYLCHLASTSRGTQGLHYQGHICRRTEGECVWQNRRYVIWCGLSVLEAVRCKSLLAAHSSSIHLTPRTHAYTGVALLQQKYCWHAISNCISQLPS